MKFTINGYKCWSKETVFDLNKLTVLTGANAAGKSSVIQSLILFRQASLIKDSDYPIVISDINLNDPKFALELGKMDDVVSNDGNGSVQLDLDDSYIEFGIDIDKNLFENAVFGSRNLSLSALSGNDFYYLNAERLAPKADNIREDNRLSVDCGCHGQYTANVLSRHWTDDVDELKKFTSGREGKFSIHFDEWVDYIFPGVTIRVQPKSSTSYTTYISTSITEDKAIAPNVGFGITYAMPILTQALLTPAGGWLLVENPEAHLHAKAQSNMGYFLGVMAASGIHVIVETHSEHIVNGIRRAIVSASTCLHSEDVNVYYCHKDEIGIRNTRIGVEPNGDLTLYPRDFFDQVSQDLRTMYEERLKNAE